MASQEQDRPSSARKNLSSAPESRQPAPVDIPFETIQHYRGMVQENTMNALRSAQARYESSSRRDVPDCVYDAIEKAKLHIAERSNVGSGEICDLETEQKGNSDPTEEGTGEAKGKSRQNDGDGNPKDQDMSEGGSVRAEEKSRADDEDADSKHQS